MGNKKSTAADKPGGVKQSSAQSKDAVVRQRINVPMVQNVLLIWLDNNIDDNSADCRNTISQLRHIVNTINKYTDSEECIQFLESMSNEKVCMIISGSLGQQIVPRVHNMSQMDSIFIFCDNQKRHEQWAKEWLKIKGVFTEISPICEALKKAIRQCEQNAISMSFMPTSGDNSKKNLDQLDSSFMYTQILKEILLVIKFEPKHFTEFINYCCDVFADNEGQLKNVDKLHRKYRDETPIWWYTYDCFLYPMINRALRLMNVDIIIKMGFFIDDLHRQIEELHQEQFGSQQTSKSFTVYRGQGMSKTEFEQMSKTKGGLMSFNNFLSTSKNHDVSFMYAESNQSNPDLIGILFVLTIDPSKSVAPFASINHVSHFQVEDEVLFSMHTVFRICDVKPMDGNHRLFQVELTLTSDNDKDLRVLTDCIRQETHPEIEGWERLELVLLKMGQSDKAEEILQILLKQTTNESAKAPAYNQLGLVKDNQGEYKEAITFFEKSIEIEQKIIPLNHRNLSNSYSNIGSVYANMGEYSKALSYREKALEIQQRSLPPNHPDLAMSYTNIGSDHRDMGEYSKALSSHEKALEIYKNTLPPIHPHLAASYNNIGAVYANMGEHSKALSYYQKALEIKQKSLPLNNPHLASSYNNIGNVYKDMGEYSKALSYYEKSLEIQQRSLPPNHPDLASSYNNIGSVHCNMGEYSKALSYYEKALEIYKNTLSSNHRHLAMSYNNIGGVHCNMGEYSKALSSHEKALEIRQQSLPLNHPDLATSYNNIGNVYKNMGEYSKALSSHEKALEIKQKSLPPNHPDLADSYNNIGNVYFDMGEYPKAVSSHEKALEIYKTTLPPYHPLLAASYNNIGNVYRDMGEYSKALSFHEKALEIRQQSLPPNHPDLACSYNNIGNVYTDMGDYSKALSSHEKVLKIQQQSLPPNHPDLAMSYNNIGNVYKDMGEYSKALSFHEKALEIRQQSLPSNHPHLAMSYNNMGTLHENMGNYSKALSFYERAVDIGQQSLPSTHPHLQIYRRNLDRVKKKL